MKQERESRTVLDLSPEELRAYHPAREPDRNRMAGRWELAWETARAAARVLRERFHASRVVLFGSLCRRDWFGPWSDIDLAAWGVASDQYYRGVAALSGISSDFKIDLVDIQDCRPELREAIEREGIDV